MSITKSLKFKLTLWNSGLLLLFCSLFLISMNVILTDYMSKEPQFGGNMWRMNPVVREITMEQRELVKEARLNDLNNIRIISLYSLIPLVLLSFGTGYVIADRTLKPLERLRDEMVNKSTENLGEEIEYVDTGDEMSGVIKSFNRMSRRLSKAFNSQREFVENASHELKTPLAVIQANIDNALDDDSISNDELKELLEDSKKSVSFMNSLTEDLLLLSVLDSHIERENVNIKDVLDSVINYSKSIIGERDFKISVSGDVDSTVYGSNVLLQRAFSNIVENSVKYSKGNRMDIEVKKKDKGIEIYFTDDGVGIPKDKMDKIFDRFYRVDKGRARNVGGSGLGLSITKEIINKHDGDICVDKEYGNGARFVVKL